MSITIIAAIVFVIALLSFFFFLKKRDSRNVLIKLSNFGPGGNKNQKADAKIIAQKIKHKGLSFYAYLISLAISFLLGAFAIYKIINHGMSWKLLPDAFAISGGVLATVSFKKLYNKCSNDLDGVDV